MQPSQLFLTTRQVTSPCRNQNTLHALKQQGTLDRCSLSSRQSTYSLIKALDKSEGESPEGWGSEGKPKKEVGFETGFEEPED